MRFFCRNARYQPLLHAVRLAGIVLGILALEIEAARGQAEKGDIGADLQAGSSQWEVGATAPSFASDLSVTAGQREPVSDAMTWDGLRGMPDELPPSQLGPSWSQSVDRPRVANFARDSEITRESTWYTRVDYFHWNERVEGRRLLNEDGVLWTLGYQRRTGQERFRGEFFTGDVGYSSRVDYADGSSEPLESHTNYMGVRGEYDLFLNTSTDAVVQFFGGIGTRLWIRDLPDDVTVSGTVVSGYQETWWTVYPYLGAEGRRIISDGLSGEERAWFWSGKIGYTAITYEHVSLNDLRLYPKPSVLGGLELGYGGPRWYMSSYLDWMNWRQSSEMRGWIQPASSQLTVGLKLGFCF